MFYFFRFFICLEMDQFQLFRVNYVLYPWASLKDARATHHICTYIKTMYARACVHAYTPVSAAVDRDCICVGGRDTLRSIYLRRSRLWLLANLSREKKEKSATRHAVPFRSGDSFERSTFVNHVLNLMRLGS